MAAALVCFSGCETTETRIKANPQLFSQLTPDQQQAIREGRVGIGFTPDMVKLALGDPDRVRIRTDAHGRSEIWNYVTYEGADGVVLYTGWYHRGWHNPYYPYYLDTPYRRAHTRERVVFREGKVVAVEQDKAT